MRYIYFFLVIQIAISCVPPDGDRFKAVKIDYTMEELRGIKDLENNRKGVELVPLFDSDDVTVRAMAALAMSSVQDTAAIMGLGNLLRTDPSQDVRYMSAYALGQSFHKNAAPVLIEAFAYQDTGTVNNKVRSAILEAVGKVGTIENLEQIATVTTYKDQDNLLLLGQARAIYRFALRGIRSPPGTQRMMKLTTNRAIDPAVRMMAANYFKRNPEVGIDSIENNLLVAYQTAEDADIRMSLGSVLARSTDPAILTSLASEMNTEKDYRIVSNILTSVGARSYPVFADSLVSLLGSSVPHVALRAAGVMREHAPPDARPALLELARNSKDPDVMATLYAASLRRTPPTFTNTRSQLKNAILAKMDSLKSIYAKKGFLSALAEDPGNIETLMGLGTDSTEQVFQTFVCEALVSSMNSPRFNIFYPTIRTAADVRENLLTFIQSILRSGNAGAIAVVAGILRDERNGYRDRIEIRPFIRNAIRTLRLPDDLETKIELERTLAALDGRTYEQEPVVAKEIDWNIIQRCTDSTYAVILTNKGRIDVQLNHLYAPASVSNFIRLAESNYYDGKYFHRVVPNFVIQAGCPRGDGYGSLDYTICSELGPDYYDDEGIMGMASAGKDTEGVQWFITHSPTPHLDGRYSIFGKVIDGMNVVHTILPGDNILQIRIVNMRFL